MLDIRPKCLSVFAYEWCSAIYQDREDLEDWESLLFLCLELGFRHLDTRRPPTDITFTHTKHHQGLIDMVFKSQNSEAIADFLHAWMMGYSLPEQMADICTGLLASLDNLVPFSPRLRQLVIRLTENAGYKGFEGVGVEKLVELLNHLHLTSNEIGLYPKWVALLMDVIRSSEGSQRLSDRYWESLVERTVSGPRWLELRDTDALKITQSLIDAMEWGKLECWVGIVWMHSESVGTTEGDLEQSMPLLFRYRPGAAQRLEQWMERWSKRCKKDIQESFQRILARAHEGVQQQDAL